eukprot:13657686-Alexandrium_andersonii.AAC.1
MDFPTREDHYKYKRVINQMPPPEDDQLEPMRIPSGRENTDLEDEAYFAPAGARKRPRAAGKPRGRGES